MFRGSVFRMSLSRLEALIPAATKLRHKTRTDFSIEHEYNVHKDKELIKVCMA